MSDSEDSDGEMSLEASSSFRRAFFDYTTLQRRVGLSAMRLTILCTGLCAATVFSIGAVTGNMYITRVYWALYFTCFLLCALRTVTINGAHRPLDRIVVAGAFMCAAAQAFSRMPFLLLLWGLVLVRLIMALASSGEVRRRVKSIAVLLGISSSPLTSCVDLVDSQGDPNEFMPMPLTAPARRK